MFIYYFDHVGKPFEQVEPAVMRMLPGLRGWAKAAYRDGERLRARVTSSERPHAIAKNVVIEVGTPLRGAGETWVPIKWEASGAPGFFPRMEADIIIGRLGDDLTQIALRGTYRVPFGLAGRALDRVLLHRVAEASIKAFVDRIARAVTEDEEVASDGIRRARAGSGG